MKVHGPELASAGDVLERLALAAAAQAFFHKLDAVRRDNVLLPEKKAGPRQVETMPEKQLRLQGGILHACLRQSGGGIFEQLMNRSAPLPAAHHPSLSIKSNSQTPKALPWADEFQPVGLHETPKEFWLIKPGASLRA
jgi:hypothetical protein